MAIKLHNSFAIHPGGWLRRNVIVPYGQTVSGAAVRLQVTRAALSNLLNEKAALSPEMAIRFEKAFAVPARVTLRMQAAHDLAQAERKAKDITVERLPEAA